MSGLDLGIYADPTLKRLFTGILDRLPHTAYQFVDVQFGPAGVDQDIAHNLTPVTPDAIDYYIVRSDRPVVVYQDNSVSRRPWGPSSIILRASQDSALVRLLLIQKRRGGGVNGGVGGLSPAVDGVTGTGGDGSSTESLSSLQLGQILGIVSLSV